MDGESHYYINYTLWIFLISAKVYLHTFTWDFFWCSFTEIMLMNPDIDLLISKLLNMQIHRNFITHSILFPLIVYWSRRPYLNMEMAKEYGYILFVPIIAHLIVDYSPIILKRNEQKKLRLKLAVPMGTWLIYIFKCRLNKYWTFVFAWSNIVLMCLYIYYI